MLYDSLHGKLLRLADSVEVFPAHGAGSLCGRSIGSEKSSTIGKEKQFNYALQPMTREAFVEMLTTDLPERPGYFARDAEINREGAEAMEELKPIEALSPEQVERLTATSQGAAKGAAIVLDTRPSGDYFAAHIPGSVHIPLSGQYASWAGAIIGLDQPIILLAEDEERVAESRMRLARVGIERVVGYAEGGIAAWQQSGRRVAQTAQIGALELRNQLAAGSEIQVVDVRRGAEWDAGHIADGRLKPLNQFAALLASNGDARAKLLADLDSARPVAVHCKSGYRGAIAASLLERAGFATVANVTGGFDAWEAQKLPKAVGHGAGV
jgi:rhodanese-related sulfurtransferase